MSSFQFPNNPFGNGRTPRPPRTPGTGKPGPLAYTLIALAIVVGILVSLTGFYTDLLWFRSVNFTKVWSTTLTTKIELFLAFGLATSAVITSNIFIAYRKRPIYVPIAVEPDNFERYRGQIDSVKRYVLAGIGIVIFYFAGMTGTKLWQIWLPFKNSTNFGVKDPQFHMDISFFVFRLPMWKSLISWGISTLVLTILATLAVHYLYGGIRPQVSQDRTTVTARVQLSVLLGVLVLIKAAAYWFDRFDLALHKGGLLTGLSFTDVNAVLPAKAILAGISVICALLFFANIIRRSWVLPSAGIALLVISAVLIAGVYPAAIQTFTVKPSESNKEAPYISRNIEATQAAYGLTSSTVTVKNYPAVISAQPGQFAKDTSNIANARLLDPNVLPATFRQLQQIKPYYTFPDALDIDRYNVKGKKQDMVVAVRELNIAGSPAQNWINDHLVYTHGFGFVSSPTNVVDADGKPSFTVGNIPSSNGLGVFQPRIYFGENVPGYSIVGGTAKSTPTELDYPDDTQATGQHNYTYQGGGGVPMGSLFDRVLFAIKYKDQQILLSNLVNKDSKILYNRAPFTRVQKAAPWLTLDGDVYPAIVNGHVLWILDGYTTSAGYPYSAVVNMATASQNSVTQSAAAVQTLPNQNINYIRNSVKATVDAFTGQVNLYQWDATDPVLKTWSKAYPGTVQPKSAISPALLQHIRYPEGMFEIQRSILATYHVNNPTAYYGGQDFWRVPSDPSTIGANAGNQPPTYQTMQLPGTTSTAFTLSASFVPRGGRQNLTAFVQVNSDPGPDYGKMTVLELPRSTNISGPSQVASNFEAKPDVAQTLSLLRQGGSDVVLGNMLTLPVGGGLLYVQPVYVRATSNVSSFPLLQKVLVSFGDQIGFGNTLQDALNQVLGGSSGVVVNNSPSASGSMPTNGGSSTLKQALANAQSALAASNQALKNGDFAAYGVAQNQLKAAIAAAVAAQGK